MLNFVFHKKKVNEDKDDEKKESSFTVKGQHMKQHCTTPSRLIMSCEITDLMGAC